MSDTPRIKKDGTIDRRYLPREFGKPAPTDDLGQKVIPGVVSTSPDYQYQAPQTPTNKPGQDSLGQQVLPGSVREKPTYSEPPLNYIEPNGGLTTDPRFENVAADTNMLVAPVIPVVAPGTAGARIVHFMEDGYTALGKMWYRGEELRVVEGSETWEQTLNKYGKSWLDMSEDDQYEKYGKRFFREGPWRGKGYDAAEFGDDAEYDPEELKKLEKKRQRLASAPMRPVSG